jgi:glutathione S-transferase
VTSQPVQIIGRSSSLFTRVPLIFAEELGIAYELAPIYDMTSMDVDSYGGNPAFKLPSMRRGDSLLFGAQNICRALAEGPGRSVIIVWPEDMHDDVSRNAQELVWHAMAAQVQIVFGTVIGKLQANNIFFTKGRAGFEGALLWLDRHAEEALSRLPPRDLSLFEVMLFCLVDHLVFRPTLPLEPYPSLVRFKDQFARRLSAQRTAYRFDVPPAG